MVSIVTALSESEPVEGSMLVHLFFHGGKLLRGGRHLGGDGFGAREILFWSLTSDPRVRIDEVIARERIAAACSGGWV